MKNYCAVPARKLAGNPLFFLSAILAVSSLFLPLSANVQTTTNKIDLNGTWMDGSREVKITQIGSSVVAKFLTPPLCDPQDGSRPKPRLTDFVGTINTNTIDGSASVCNFGKSWGAKIGIQSTNMVLTISADQNTLAGTYDSKNGPASMSLTRKCAPDIGDLCQSVGSVIQAMGSAISANASAALYANLKSNVGIELSKIKNNLCNDSKKSAEVEALQRELDSLNYVEGRSNINNNRTLAQIEDQSKQLNVDLCHVSSKDIPSPVGCPQGTQAKSDVDQSLLNSFKSKLELNLSTGTFFGVSQTKKCLDQLSATVCTPDGFIQNFRLAAKAWNDGPPATDVCTRACQALGAWYSATACSKGGMKEEVIISKCMLTCKTSDFTQTNPD